MTPLTLADRAAAYAAMFPKFHASHLRVVKESGRPVLYGTWLLGNDYRNKTRYYGAYPPSYLQRVSALFPDIEPGRTLHVFSGSLPRGPYLRLDVNPDNGAELVGDACDVAELIRVLGDGFLGFDLICADPPYSADDAARYGTAMIDRRRCVAALAEVCRSGGFLVWLDTVWPQFSKRQWRTVGRIQLIRSTNHRVRLVSIFERVTG
jgi:hypothetical protein